MFNKSIFNSLMSALASVFVAPTSKKPAKRYPTMVVSSPREIAEWNAKVAAGKVSPKGHRHA